MPDLLDIEEELCECGHMRAAHVYDCTDDFLATCSAWVYHKHYDIMSDCTCVKYKTMEWITGFCAIPEMLNVSQIHT